MSPYLLIIVSHAPYHSSSAIDAFEAALAASNVGLTVKLLFQHDGVYQLLDSQNPEQIGHKNMFKKLSSLPLFEIDEIYLEQASLDSRALRITESAINWQSLGKSDMIHLMQSAAHILVF